MMALYYFTLGLVLVALLAKWHVIRRENRAAAARNENALLCPHGRYKHHSCRPCAEDFARVYGPSSDELLEEPELPEGPIVSPIVATALGAMLAGPAGAAIGAAIAGSRGFLQAGEEEEAPTPADEARPWQTHRTEMPASCSSYCLELGYRLRPGHVKAISLPRSFDRARLMHHDPAGYFREVSLACAETPLALVPRGWCPLDPGGFVTVFREPLQVGRGAFRIEANTNAHGSEGDRIGLYYVEEF